MAQVSIGLTLLYIQSSVLTMGYGIDSAEWPTGIEVPSPVKQLIERFYQLLDSSDPGIGDLLADEIFADNGVAYFGATPFSGTEGLCMWRATCYTRSDRT